MATKLMVRDLAKGEVVATKVEYGIQQFGQSLSSGQNPPKEAAKEIPADERAETPSMTDLETPLMRE
jgi:hypothetical protein